MDVWGVSEPVLRLGVFAAVLLSLLGAEAVWPRRALVLGRRRWPTNLSILVLGGITVRALGAVSPLLLAVGASGGLARVFDETGMSELLAEYALHPRYGVLTPFLAGEESPWQVAL